ncbi:hypothetical protein IJ182_09885 [bacterium]|nr:hypothetical protein [bacterium]
MKKIIICIVIYALQFNIPSLAIGLELSDIIKEARDIEMQKSLAVKNTVKEIKKDIESKEAEKPATETINPQTIQQETLEK